MGCLGGMRKSARSNCDEDGEPELPWNGVTSGIGFLVECSLKEVLVE